MTQISGKTFTEIYNNFAGLSVADTKHLRFERAKGLYTNDKFCLQWILDYFQCEAERSAARRRAAGPCIWSAIVQQHGEQVASDIFKEVLSCEDESHEVEISWDHMKQIKQKLNKTATAPTADRGDAAGGGGQPAVSPGPLHEMSAPELRSIAESKSSGDLQHYIMDNLLVNLSIDQLDSVCGTLPKDVQRTFRKIMAWCYYRRLTDDKAADLYSHVSAWQSSKQFLRLLGITPDKKDLSFLETSNSSLDKPNESTRKWMLDQIYLELYCDKVECEEAPPYDEPRYYKGYLSVRNQDYGEKTLGGYDSLYNSTSDRKSTWLEADGIPGDHVAEIARAIDRKLDA